MPDDNTIGLDDAMVGLIQGIAFETDTAIDARFAAFEKRWHEEDARPNAVRQHASPNGSSTHLPTQIQKAEQKVYTLRKAAYEVMRTASATFFALREKEAEAKHLAERLAEDRATKCFEKEEFTDHERKLIIDLHRHNVGPWHIDQLPQPIRAIIADLIRWYCEDRSATDPASPWGAILQQYSGRTVLKPGERCGASAARSLPEPPPPYRHKHIPDRYYRIAAPARVASASPSPAGGRGNDLLSAHQDHGDRLQNIEVDLEAGAADSSMDQAVSVAPPSPSSPASMWDHLDIGPLRYTIEEVEIPSEVASKVSEMRLPPFSSIEELNTSPMARSMIESSCESGDLDLAVKLVRYWSTRSNIALDDGEILAWVFLLVAVQFPNKVVSSDRKKMFHGLLLPGPQGSNAVRRVLSAP